MRAIRASSRRQRQRRPSGYDTPSLLRIAAQRQPLILGRGERRRCVGAFLAKGREPALVIVSLARTDPAAYGILTEVVTAAYFMNPDVRKAVGYTGQGPSPLDPRVDYMEDGLLESVIKRGPIYRPTPKP